MSKRKKTYQSKGNIFPVLILSGNVYLKFEDEEKITTPQKGDLMVYLSSDSDPRTLVMGEYGSKGLTGFLKADVWDGKQFCPLDIHDFFPDRENYYRKSELPIDTYNLCAPLLRLKAGATLKRTYREHYSLSEES